MRRPGFTLFEMMIAVGALTLVLGGGMALFANTLKHRSAVLDSTQAQEQLRRIGTFARSQFATGDFLGIRQGSTSDVVALKADPGTDFLIQSSSSGTFVIRPVAGSLTLNTGDLLFLRDGSSQSLVVTVTSSTASSGNLNVVTDSTCDLSGRSGIKGVRALPLRFATGSVLNSESGTTGFDSDSLYASLPGKPPSVVSPDLSRVQLRYLYRSPSGAVISNPTTANGFSDSYPQNVVEMGGQPYRLNGISFLVGKTLGSGTSELSRADMSTVALKLSPTYFASRTVGCGGGGTPGPSNGVLDVVLNGLPATALAAISLNGPQAATINAPGSFNLAEGGYTLTAQTVTDSVTPANRYQPSITTAAVAIGPYYTSQVTINYTLLPQPTGTLAIGVATDNSSAPLQPNVLIERQ